MPSTPIKSYQTEVEHLSRLKCHITESGQTSPHPFKGQLNKHVPGYFSDAQGISCQKGHRDTVLPGSERKAPNI